MSWSAESAAAAGAQGLGHEPSLRRRIAGPRRGQPHDLPLIAVAEGVERSAVHALLAWAKLARGGYAEGRQAFFELLGRLTVECQGEDPFGSYAAANELEDALDHRPGLAGAGGRQDACRSRAVQHGGPLALVELRIWVCCREAPQNGGGRRAGAGGVRRPPLQQQPDVLEVEPLPLVYGQALTLEGRGGERERHAEALTVCDQGIDEPAEDLAGTVAQRLGRVVPVPHGHGGGGSAARGGSRRGADAGACVAAGEEARPQR